MVITSQITGLYFTKKTLSRISMSNLKSLTSLKISFLTDSVTNLEGILEKNYNKNLSKSKSYFNSKRRFRSNSNSWVHNFWQCKIRPRYNVINSYLFKHFLSYKFSFTPNSSNLHTTWLYRDEENKNKDQIPTIIN